jgi:hypothetical protein
MNFVVNIKLHSSGIKLWPGLDEKEDWPGLDEKEGQKGLKVSFTVSVLCRIMCDIRGLV